MEATEMNVLSWKTLEYSNQAIVSNYKWYSFRIDWNKQDEVVLYIVSKKYDENIKPVRHCRCLEDAKAKAELFILKQLKK